MGTDEVRGSDDEHEFRMEILKNVIDGVEVCEVLFPQLFSLSLSEIFAYLFIAASWPVQENQRKVLVMLMNIQAIGIFVDLFSILKHEAYPQPTEISHGHRGYFSIESMVQQYYLMA